MVAAPVLPDWYMLAACQPGESAVSLADFIPSDASYLDAEFAAAARAAADGVTAAMRKRYDIYFLDLEKPNLEPSAAARAMCAQCPVIVDCAEESIDRSSYGLAGGIGESERRILRALRAEDDTCNRFTNWQCECAYCVQLAEYTAPEQDGPRQRNGKGARCGHVSTYARGHRDTACTFAMSVAARKTRFVDDHHDDIVSLAKTRRPPPCKHADTQCNACQYSTAVRNRSRQIAA